MTIRRIEAGILGNLTDMDITMTPFEAGLAPFIHMDKSDFVVSTSLHDFQGLSILEAVSRGCLPLLPKRVVYPEYFSERPRPNRL